MKISTHKENQSIADYLLRLMPGLELRLTQKPMIDPLAARTLFSIWKNQDNRIEKNLYRRPTTVSASLVDSMSKAGLVKDIGGKIEITEKGADVIKVMVLGDNSSIFDRADDRIIDYATALNNTKQASVRRGKGLSKKASTDWWERFD